MASDEDPANALREATAMMERAGNFVPLLRATHLRPFLATLREVGAPVEKLLHSAKLPLTVYDDTEASVPELRAWKLCHLAAQSEGIDHFGHRVAVRYPLWISEPELCRAVTGAPTLRAGLEILCQLANGVSTACSYGFRSIDGQWLLYGVKLNADGRTEVTLYQLTVLTQIVQLVAGRAWRPSEVWAAPDDIPPCRALEMFSQARFRSSTLTGIIVPDPILLKPMGCGHAATADSSEAQHRPLPDELVPSLRCAIRAYLPDRRPDIGFAVDLTGLSERTLQRRLAQHGLNYSRLLGEVRFEMARKQLEQSDIKITEIAYDLGFKDVAHFTRAFQHWSGVSPRRFRQIRAAA